MSNLFTNQVRILIVSACSLFIVVLLSACQGVVTSSGNGYNNSGTATTGSHTQPQEATNNNTSTPTAVANQSGTPPVQGSIQFAGKVQSVNGSSFVVNTPDGQSLSINIVIGQTDTSDMNDTPLSSGQIVKVKARTDQNGNFVAERISIDKPDDQQYDMSNAQYQGMTTNAVGTSNRISFKVGNNNYSFPISTRADLSDFNDNAQSIGNNVAVKVRVIFNGTNGTAVDISNPNN